MLTFVIFLETMITTETYLSSWERLIRGEVTHGRYINQLKLGVILWCTNASGARLVSPPSLCSSSNILCRTISDVDGSQPLKVYDRERFIIHPANKSMGLLSVN